MAFTYTQLNEIEKGKIPAYMETTNAAQIAKILGRDPTTVRRFVNEQEKVKTYHVQEDHQSLITKDLLIREANEKRRAPLREIVNNLGLTCSLSTAANVLHNSGLNSCIAAKKPYISETHAHARIKWCEENKNKSAYDWAKIIFSDETSVEVGKQSRQPRVWWHPAIRTRLTTRSRNERRKETSYTIA